MVTKKKKVFIILGCIIFFLVLIALWIISTGIQVHNSWNEGYELGFVDGYVDFYYYSMKNCMIKTTEGELEGVNEEEGELKIYVAWVFCRNLWENKDFKASNTSLTEDYQIFLDNAN